jgi:DNA-directed RNA polymerase subunit alpha
MCEAETLTSTYGQFVAEPFERGFGTTIGNSLRRVLLSSIEGSAVTSVKFEGVPHEFSSIEGVVEDVTDIILNIKRLVVRLHSDKPKTVTVEKNQKGEIKAADIKADPTVEIIDPDHHIATLNKDGRFSMEMVIEKGRGYVPASVDQKEEQEIGLIPIDALFSPVERVRYNVENTRVGQRTNYDRLIIEIWTNGVITPEGALVEASKILRKHLNPFIQHFELGQELKKGAAGKGPLPALTEAEDQREKLSKGFDEMDLSVRATHCLQAAGLQTIGDVVTRTEGELLKLKNFGKTSLQEIKKKLQAMGLSLGMKIE